MRRATTTSARYRIQQGRQGVETAGLSYSPIFCIGLLLSIALVMSIGG